MTIALYPAMADAAHVRVWLGITGQSQAPAPSWAFGALSGAPVAATPEVVRPLSPARGMVPPANGAARAFSGLFEFPVPPAAGVERPAFRVQVSVGAETATLVTRPLPSDFEPGPTGGFTLLLASCYCHDEDDGALGRTARFVASRFRPDATLLMGDQVYLDIPTTRNLPEKNPALLDVLEANYARNWLPDGRREYTFADLLKVAPVLCLPDDHEYWNNAPHVSPFIQNSWTNAGRLLWRRNGDALFDGYQNVTGTPGQPHVTLDVGPLSLFVANGRTARKEDRSASFSAQTREAFAAWATQVGAQGRFPAFLTGQSMLDLPSSKLSGAAADYMQSNYGDYPEVMSRLDRLAKDVADVLLLTGDVHWGRVAELTPTGSLGTQTRLYEVISSPSTLVTTIGADFFSRAKNWLGGSKERWPRHSDTPDPPSVLRLPGSSYVARTLFPHKGDQLCVLRLTRAPAALDVTAHYIEVGTNRVSTAPTFRMRRRAP
ncbi:MAG: hypothetical protein JNJ54_04370 [Myxococcaceae bacterium]|nr:hypothetical protein [Myxococcaceae bacterium]